MKPLDELATRRGVKAAEESAIPGGPYCPACYRHKVTPEELAVRDAGGPALERCYRDASPLYPSEETASVDTLRAKLRDLRTAAREGGCLIQMLWTRLHDAVGGPPADGQSSWARLLRRVEHLCKLGLGVEAAAREEGVRW